MELHHPIMSKLWDIGAGPKEKKKIIILWINMLPAPRGISETLSPREIITEESTTYAKHFKAVFG